MMSVRGAMAQERHQPDPLTDAAPDRGHSDVESYEPTHSETRERMPRSLAAGPQSVPPQSVPPGSARESVRPGAHEPPRRPSVRPSAFGPPRPSTASGGFAAAPQEAGSLPASQQEHPRRRASDRAPSPVGGTMDARAPERTASASVDPLRLGSPGATGPGFRAQVEELLPLTDVTQSMPRIPLAAVLPATTESVPPDSGRTLLQVGAFALVVIASIVPILRYTGVLTPEPKASDSTVAAQAAVAPLVETAPALSAAELEAHEAEPEPELEEDSVALELPAAPDEAADALAREALRALDAGDEETAESLLGRALKLDERNPHAAFGLARVRLAQNNLEGAEGWVLSALRLRPRRAEYHALYAEVLSRQGHSAHAKRERRKARKLRR